MADSGEDASAVRINASINGNTLGNNLAGLLTKGIQERVENKVEELGFYSRQPGEKGAPIFASYPELPKTCYISFKERLPGNKVLFCFYKLLRAFYVPWFYFMPYLFYYMMYLYPVLW